MSVNRVAIKCQELRSKPARSFKTLKTNNWQFLDHHMHTCDVSLCFIFDAFISRTKSKEYIKTKWLNGHKHAAHIILYYIIWLSGSKLWQTLKTWQSEYKILQPNAKLHKPIYKAVIITGVFL